MDLKDNIKRFYWRNKNFARAINSINNLVTKDVESCYGDYIYPSSAYFNYRRDPFPYKSIILDNNFYSILSIFKKLGLDSNAIYAEHGLFLGDYFQDKIVKSWVQGVVTFSTFRKQIIESHGLEVMPIGPYIHYVENYNKRYCKEDYILAILKHSGTNEVMSLKNSLNEFIFQLQNKYGKKIVIQLHPNDLNLTEELDRSIYWTTCGFKRDPEFLIRQRSLLSHAEFVITDFVGTHLGYCEYLEKPVLRVKSIFDKDFVLRNKNDLYEFRKSKADLKVKQVNKILKFMPLNEFALNDEYKKIVRDLWGFKYLK